ncbi:hypothetical protein [Nocardia alni]|uniref:hypothetical protein n=1 Tax=Nocardia alni TaxID=2815723 RepID=UPI001C24005B|nr:hypothetical protein [Nocardia alni]
MTLREKINLPAGIDDSMVFGTPYQTPDGATIITVARPGGRFRPGLRPLGIVVVQGRDSKWIATKDESLLAFVGVLTGLVAATLSTVAVVRRPPWPDTHISLTGDR